jgi:predicted ATPase/DNA-binding winged helix-turn-helix (wHTH) protein
LIGLGVLCQTGEEPVLDVVAMPVMPAEQGGSPSASRIIFGQFELNVAERSLKKADEAIPLGGRAFDILMALIDRAGEVVTKSELIAKAWPDITVEEGSLRVHLSALRKALGDGQFSNRYISNVQGRGYCFVAPVTRQPETHDQGGTFARVSNLPPPLRRMVGRDDVVREVRARLRAERLITVLGAGGIGKTTIAVAVGHAVSADFSDGVFFIDLSTLRHKEQVIGAVASAIGLDHEFVDPLDSLLNFLRTRKALIVFDSCEHLIEATAELADGIFRHAPDVCMLAASREPLQTAGECTFRLPPLDCPPEQARLTATEALSYPAARLFVERINARGNSFLLSDNEAHVVAEICRRLDGIALAIELAAGRAAIFGIRDTLARLGSRLDLLKFGRRTANPRHQTLRATLDWSHDHLSEVERVVLRRVAIFVGNFTLGAALEVARETGIGRYGIVDAVGNLADKSLIGISSNARETFYRLLNTTRSYALEKLVVSGEHHSIAQRHANFSIQFLENNRINIFDLRPTEAPVDSLRDYLGNIRAALEWSFGPNGNDRTAIRLAAAASQLLLAMALLLECRKWMELAIDRMVGGCNPRHQMEVHAALALSLMHSEESSQRIRETFDTALDLAQRHEDTHLQLCLLSGMSMHLHRIVDAAGTYELALRGVAVARKIGSPDHAALAASMLGAAYCLRTDQPRAQEHLKRSLDSLPHLRRFNASQYLFDLRSSSLVLLIHSLFFSGNLDQAADCAKMNIEVAVRSGHPIGVCRALIHPMRLHFWCDDLEQVERNLTMLEHVAESHSLAPLRAVALGLRGRYLIRTGRLVDGVQHLQESLEKLAIHRYEIFTNDLVSELAVALANQNARPEALALIDQSIAAAGNANKPLHLPFFLLAKGSAFASGDSPENLSAEQYFAKAMLQARQESALPFELRAGLELARIWIERGEIESVHDLIEPIYDRFSEGLATPDLILAKRMLEQTSAPDRQKKRDPWAKLMPL